MSYSELHFMCPDRSASSICAPWACQKYRQGGLWHLFYDSLWLKLSTVSHQPVTDGPSFQSAGLMLLKGLFYTSYSH